jgi:bla regulator protein BlaR1
MMENYLSPAWHAAALGLGNHLWQSTLVAVAAALLTLALRKHHARARYWIWLAASIKFLIPFSLLVAVGSDLAWQRHPAETTKPPLYFAIEEISQPFTPPAVRVPSVPTSSLISTSLTHLLPWIAAVWLSGFLVVLLIWSVRWRKVAAAMKAASPSSEGRELAALRRIERIGGIRKPIALLLSPASLEPGIFGIARPALIWPEGISPRLEDAHLEAILAHEVWHVRRRDNLAAALHMLVEAVFWFHPLVWWLGARLVEERERACDEQVVAWGSDPQVYAESILKVCEFCLGSPLPCVSGVTGADLKQRMVRIMSHRMLHNLDFARKALLASAAVLAIAIPVTIGLLHATPTQAQSSDATAPVFSSVSVKAAQSSGNESNHFQAMFSLRDGSFSARGITLERLIQDAYHVQDSQVSGGPDWLKTATFDVDAKFDPQFVAAMQQGVDDHKDFDNQTMLKALLANQFKLATHTKSQTLPVYDLVVDSGGAKLQAATGMRMMRMGPGDLSSSGTPIEFLVQQLAVRLGQPVIDKTGLKGTYTYTLHWTPDPNEAQHVKQAGLPEPDPPSTDPNGPSLVTAVQEQLGLKLEPQTAAVPVMVIDHAEAPAENE